MNEQEVKQAADELVDSHILHRPIFEEGVGEATKRIWEKGAKIEATEHAIITVKAQIEEAKWWDETSEYNEECEFLGGMKRINTLEAILKELEQRI